MYLKVSENLKKNTIFQVPSSAGSVDDVAETTPGLEVSVKTGSNLRKLINKFCRNFGRIFL